MAPVPPPVRVRRYELGSTPYQQLLRDYLARRLKLDRAKPEGAKLADAIIRAADSRFAHVSFLADRHERGQVRPGEIGAGTGLYRLWLENLQREYGRKQADAIRQVLALLAAAEEAHAWVFGDGRKIDPATGGALTPLPEQFQGLEIGLLASLLDRDRAGAAAYDRIDPGLLYTLQTLQGVIWVSRAGEGATQFRLALKEFLPAAKADPVLGPMLPLLQARIATKALDAAEQISKDGWSNADGAGPRFLALAPLLEAAMHLSGSESVAKRWRPLELVKLLVRHNAELEPLGYALERVPWQTLMVAWLKQQGFEGLDPEQRSAVAGCLQDRGITKADVGDFAGAIADYEAAIELMQAIRAAFGTRWPIWMQNDLASALNNLGNAKKTHRGDFAGAVADFDAAIKLRTAVRAGMGKAWTVELANDLAASLQNRGRAKQDAGDLVGAVIDYDAAIGLIQPIRAAMGKAWPAPMQADFAGALASRGGAKMLGGDLAGAIADYDVAIMLFDAALRTDWSAPLQDRLAVSLTNRGQAKAQGGDIAGAIVDYDIAIKLMQAIRAPLGAAWPVPLQDHLADALQRRGLAKSGMGDVAGAIVDYDASIELMKAIRALLGVTWPASMQYALAGSLYNRGLAKWSLHQDAGAHADADAAFEIQERLVSAPGTECPRSYRRLLDRICRLQQEAADPLAPRSLGRNPQPDHHK